MDNPVFWGLTCINRGQVTQSLKTIVPQQLPVWESGSCGSVQEISGGSKLTNHLYTSEKEAVLVTCGSVPSLGAPPAPFWLWNLPLALAKGPSPSPAGQGLVPEMRVFPAPHNPQGGSPDLFCL